MKVFISWSGDSSHRVATILRDWLPSVIQSVAPYVSSEDIDKGTRWSTDIAGELEESAYGILCITKENVVAPWINFEAGALGKSIDKGRVSPFLFRIKRSEVEGPILQYQSTIFEKPDVLKLLRSLNSACGPEELEPSRLEKSFEIWWPQLKTALEQIPETQAEERSQKGKSPKDLGNEVSRVLEEVLELTRNNHRILRDPMTLLPPDYVEHVLRRSRRGSKEDVEVRGFEGAISPEALRDLVERYREVIKFVKVMDEDVISLSALSEMRSLLNQMDAPLRYIANEMGLRLPKILSDGF